MSKPPYRADPEGSDADGDLARLAAEGERHIRDAKAVDASRAETEAHALERKRETNVRIALGAYYGSPARKACFALMGVGVSTFVAGRLLGLGGAAAEMALVLGLFALIGGFLATSWIDPVASHRRGAAERAWAASLPFAMQGYFDLLAQDPVIACRLLVELAWEPGGMPAPEMVRGALGVWDAEVDVEPSEAASMSVRSSPFVCGYHRRSSGELLTDPLPNPNLVRRVHALVDKVLLPLHRSRALMRVSLRREIVHPQPGERFSKA